MSRQKKRMIPNLAISGIYKNSSTYLPYIGISIFAMFTFFVFDLIINNDIIKTVPNAAYAYMMMMVGFFLLGIIMIPFLSYTNSFLIKRRKKELGLYSILGMEKKHIGFMMLLETFIIYVIVCVFAVCLGFLFSKLLFLLLLNLTGLPVDVKLTFNLSPVKHTLIFYGGVSLLNLIQNLIQVGKANPIELMSQSKKGEKEPRFILIWTILGVAAMAGGYYIAVTAKIDSNIFINFFSAVFLVIVGTYFLFTSGSIFFLRRFKNNKKAYYKSSNFITISGMLYRMKKSAASLVNICIFSTMVLITVICTVGVYLGNDSIEAFMYPFQVEASFQGREAAGGTASGTAEGEAAGEEFADLSPELRSKAYELAEYSNVTLDEYIGYSSLRLSVVKDEEGNLNLVEEDSRWADRYKITLMTVDELNRLEGKNYEIQENEVLVFSSGADYNNPGMAFMGEAFKVKEELMQSSITPKAKGNTLGEEYIIAVDSIETLAHIGDLFYTNADDNMSYKILIKASGSEEDIMEFYNQFTSYVSPMTGFQSSAENLTSANEIKAMDGGLLFIGIFFGTIFFMCLLIIMYYKQITEGFEDQASFDIMQKVGMSDEEVRHTIRKQILMVFFLPLFGAMLHTAIGMNMVVKLLGTLNLFNNMLLIGCAVFVCVVFGVIYIISYNHTAKTYYSIVRKMAV